MPKKQAEQYQLCTFMAATNAGPYEVHGSFVMHEGLAIVIHKGYGADLKSPNLFASEYGTGIIVAETTRSQLFPAVSRFIKSKGGPSGAKEHLLKLGKAQNSAMIAWEYWDK